MRIAHLVLTAALTLALLPSTGFAQEKLTLLADKSKIEFVGTKPDGKHEGGFKEFRGEVIPGKGGDASASLALEIATESLFSDNPKLTAHLKSPDFFNVRTHPKATFTSTKLEKMSDTSGVIHGKLTLLGKSKEIAVPVQVSTPEGVVVFNAQFEIDRTDFGMDYGAGKIDNKVKISAELHFPKN